MEKQFTHWDYSDECALQALCDFFDWYYSEYSPGQMERMHMYRDENGNYQFYD